MTVEVAFSKRRRERSLSSIFDRKSTIMIFILIWIIPSIILSLLNYANPFIWIPLSETASGIYSGSLDISSSPSPAYTIILYILTSVCNIPPETLAFLPIGGIIVPICMFALSRHIFHSNMLAIILTTYVAFDFSLLSGQYSVFAYSWTRPLFLCFLFLFILYTFGNEQNLGIPLLLIVIFIATFFFHPTYSFWIILFCLFINILIFISKKLNLQSVGIRKTTGIFLIFTIVYFGFSELVYGVYLKRLVSYEQGLFLDDFIGNILEFIGVSTTTHELYEFNEPLTDPLINYILLFRTLIILFTILILIILWLYVKRTKLREAFNNNIILALTLIIVGVGHIVGYAIYGHMSLRFMTFFYPIVIVLFLLEINSNRCKGLSISNSKGYHLSKSRINIVCIFIITLIAALAIFQTVFFAKNQIDYSEDYLLDTDIVSSWSLKNSQLAYSESILTDFETSQMMKMYYNSQGLNIRQIYYNSTLFGEVVFPRYLNYQTYLIGIDYLIINWEMRFTYSNSWKVYEPLSKYSSEIYNNNQLSNVYSNSEVGIFIPK